jgi:predicted  nucleic acid-binding Zn-ribbon protein
MSDDQFTKLFKYIERRFDELAHEVEDVRGQVSQVNGTVDGIAKQLDTDAAERAAITRQLDRHDRWHHQTADKLGLKLDYQEQ